MPIFRGNAKITFTYEVRDIEVDAENEDVAAELIEEAACEMAVDTKDLDFQDCDVDDVQQLDDEEEEEEDDDEEEADEE